MAMERELAAAAEECASGSWRGEAEGDDEELIATD